MDANQDIVHGQWPTLKGQVKQQWGNLTDDDVRQLSGTTAGLVNALQRRYGYGKVQAEIEIDKWVHGYDQAHLAVLERVSGKIKGEPCLKINPSMRSPSIGGRKPSPRSNRAMRPPNR